SIELPFEGGMISAGWEFLSIFCLELGFELRYVAHVTRTVRVGAETVVQTCPHLQRRRNEVPGNRGIADPPRKHHDNKRGDGDHRKFRSGGAVLTDDE